MTYTPNQQAYIDSVGGNAHARAVDIIGGLDAEIELLRKVSESAKRFKAATLGTLEEHDAEVALNAALAELEDKA
jgi:hypothetical protein